MPRTRATRDDGVMDTPENGLENGLDALDRELLNAVQWDFPLDPRPYAVLGERLGIAEPEVRARVARSRTRACCASSRRSSTPARSATRRRSSRRKVDPDRIDEAAAIISEHPGVSHNYKRNHAYNLWYTVAVPPGDVARRAPRRAAPRVGRARHAQAADAEALQDRREARHDRQDRGQREGRGARAREARAQGRDAGARALRPRASRRSASCRRTCRSSSGRSPRRPSAIGCSTRTSVLDDARARSRSAS